MAPVIVGQAELAPVPGRSNNPAMPDGKAVYITTPIYYPNGEPHLGHIYTTVCADVLARAHRQAGRDVWFLTGTDEHGIKMVKSAAEEGVTPGELATRNSGVFRDVFAELGLSNNDFIRTSEPRHRESVSRIVTKMLQRDDIYLGSYEGWYDEGQEEFITETEARDADFKSRISGRPLVRYKEPTYFFRLTRYVERVRAAIESGQLRVLPESRRNEILSKLRGWDQDLSISRSSLNWGIPMPNDPGHVLYVWIDALSNYITALGYGSNDQGLFDRFWPADVHLIGKEILWFHAFYWPAMLMSLDLPLPRTIFAHGWWTSEGRKMSKSMGNFVGLQELRGLSSTYGIDTLRCYLLRAAPFGSDLDFVQAELDRTHAELGNVVGNLLNRVLNMLNKYRGGVVPPAGVSGAEDAALMTQLDAIAPAMKQAIDGIELQRFAVLPLELARAANVYIDQTRPFSLAKDAAQQGRLDTVLHLAAQSVYSALLWLVPVLPTKAIEGLHQLGVDAPGSPYANPRLDVGHRVRTGTPLFPRLEKP
jgi:methionyl-tRNA synthetase